MTPPSEHAAVGRASGGRFTPKRTCLPRHDTRLSGLAKGGWRRATQYVEITMFRYKAAVQEWLLANARRPAYRSGPGSSVLTWPWTGLIAQRSSFPLNLSGDLNSYRATLVGNAIAMLPKQQNRKCHEISVSVRPKSVNCRLSGKRTLRRQAEYPLSAFRPMMCRLKVAVLEEISGAFK